MNNKIVKEIISWILVIAIAFGLATFINKVIILRVWFRPAPWRKQS
jgi:FlaG/FlaF family flagellin (archaellin)